MPQARCGGSMIDALAADSAPALAWGPAASHRIMSRSKAWNYSPPRSGPLFPQPRDAGDSHRVPLAQWAVKSSQVCGIRALFRRCQQRTHTAGTPLRCCMSARRMDACKALACQPISARGFTHSGSPAPPARLYIDHGAPACPPSCGPRTRAHRQHQHQFPSRCEQ